MSNSLRAKNLLSASETSSCQLLKEVKKIKGSKKDSHDLPDRVGGAVGENQIVDEFKKVYNALYNSSDTSNDMFNLKAKLAAEISEDSVVEANMITGAILKKAACTMEPKKSDISKSWKFPR